MRRRLCLVFTFLRAKEPRQLSEERWFPHVGWRWAASASFLPAGPVETQVLVPRGWTLPCRPRALSV